MIDDGHGSDDLLRLVLEVTDQRDGRDDSKHGTMRALWVPAVNAVRGFGRWQFLMVDGPCEVEKKVRTSISKGELEGLSREFWAPLDLDSLMAKQGLTKPARYEDLIRSSALTAEDANELREAIDADRKRRREWPRRS